MGSAHVLASYGPSGRGTGGFDVVQVERRAAEGDRSAWDRLVEQYARLIWALTREFMLAETTPLASSR